MQEIGGEPRAISGEGLIGVPVVSPDGRIATNIDHKAMLFTAAGGPPQPLRGLIEGEVLIAWTPDGRSIYVSRGETAADVSIVDVASGARTPWKTLAPSDRAGTTGVRTVRIGADGKSYAYSYTRVLSELYLVAGVK